MTERGKDYTFFGGSVIAVSGILFSVTGLVYALHQDFYDLNEWCDYIPLAAQAGAQILLIIGLVALMVSLSHSMGIRRFSLESLSFSVALLGCGLWLLADVFGLPLLYQEFGLGLLEGATFPVLDYMFSSFVLINFALWGGQLYLLADVPWLASVIDMSVVKPVLWLLSSIDVPTLLYISRFLAPIGFLCFAAAIWQKSRSPAWQARLGVHMRWLLLFGALLSLVLIIDASPSYLGAFLWILFGIFWIAIGYQIRANQESRRRERIDNRVLAALNTIGTRSDDPKVIQVSNYVESLRDSIKGTEVSIRRTMVLLFALFLVFELLVQGALQEASIAGYKVTSLSLIQQMFPLLIAYSYFELVSLIFAGWHSRQTYREVLKRVNSSVVDKKLDHYLLPSSTFTAVRAVREIPGPFRGITRVLQFPVFGAIFVGPILFEFYAFSRNLESFPCSTLVWLVISVSILYLIQGIVVFLRMWDF